MTQTVFSEPGGPRKTWAVMHRLKIHRAVGVPYERAIRGFVWRTDCGLSFYRSVVECVIDDPFWGAAVDCPACKAAGKASGNVTEAGTVGLTE